MLYIDDTLISQINIIKHITAKKVNKGFHICFNILFVKRNRIICVTKIVLNLHLIIIIIYFTSYISINFLTLMEIHNKIKLYAKNL